MALRLAAGRHMLRCETMDVLAPVIVDRIKMSADWWKGLNMKRFRLTNLIYGYADSGNVARFASIFRAVWATVPLRCRKRILNQWRYLEEENEEDGSPSFLPHVCPVFFLPNPLPMGIWGMLQASVPQRVNCGFGVSILIRCRITS